MIMLEFIRRHLIPSPTFIFAVGAGLIIGFLSFSGMYVLLPVLAVAIVAFVLSVAYEGEIYYQNIKNAFNKLFNPHYYKEQLAKECLRELLPIMEEKKRQFLKLQAKFELDTLLEELSSFCVTGTPSEEQVVKYEAYLKNIHEYIPNSPTVEKLPTAEQFSKTHPFVLRGQLSALHDALMNETNTFLKSHDTTPFFDDFLRLLQIYHQYDSPNLSGYELKLDNTWTKTVLSKRIIHLSQQDGKICYSLITPNGQEIYKLPTHIDAPKPFNLTKLNDLKPQILAVMQANQHVQADHRDDKEKLKKTLQTLERAFIDQLFRSESQDSTPTPMETAKYLKGLHEVLNQDRATWITKLKKRRFAFRVTQGLSVIAALFMMLGSSFLLVEAFSVFPFMAAIPFGIWPAFVVPMAVIAGTAFGLLTFNAVTDLINDDIILNRYRKIKADWKAGLTLRSGLMLFATVSLMALTIALTVCTAGTWWTVIKHTRPIFAFMRHIPAAVIGFVAAVLGAASLAFNATNTLQTLEEFDEIDGEVGEHPYNIDLCELEVGEPLPNNLTRLTLIKQGRQYWVYGSSDGKKWQYTELPGSRFARLNFQRGYSLALMSSLPDGDIENAVQGQVYLSENPKEYFVKGMLGKAPLPDSINLTDLSEKLTDIQFKKDILKMLSKAGDIQPRLAFGWRNAFIYLFIKRFGAHTFIPGRATWAQWLSNPQTWNPFRIILKLTYTPLRIVFFLGHLVSIGVTSDRLPGLDEILSALIGIVAEFFEDWHYFFSFEHAHRDDIQSLYDEYSEKEGGHDHKDDFPTRILRTLFYPCIYLAAWWDSAFSARQQFDNPVREYASWWGDSEKVLSFEEAMDKHLGLQAQKEVTLNEEDKTYLSDVYQEPESVTASSTSLPLPVATPVVQKAHNEQPYVLDNLAKIAAKQDAVQKRVRDFSLFKPRDMCCNRPHNNKRTDDYATTTSHILTQ